MPSNSPSKNVRKLKKEVSKSSVASDPLEELASLPPSPKKPRIDHQPVSSGLSSAARSAMSRIPRDPQNVSLPMTPELKGLLDKVKEARKGGGTANHDVQKALDHVIRYRELAKGGSEIEVLKTQMEQAEVDLSSFGMSCHAELHTITVCSSQQNLFQHGLPPFQVGVWQFTCCSRFKLLRSLGLFQCETQQPNLYLV